MKTLLFSIALMLCAPLAYAETIKAPEFTLPDVDGNSITLPRSHDGVDIYLFWANWCPYCKAVMPHLQSMQVEYGDDVKIFALQIRDDEDPREFMQDHGYDFTLIPHADSIMASYGVKPIPAVLLVDGKGNIRFNLYDMIVNDGSKFAAMSHGKKAGRRAPYWAAEIRQRIDRILAESASEGN